MHDSKIGQLMQDYEQLRKELIGLPIDKLKVSEDYKKLLRFQDCLVILVSELDQNDEQKQIIRDLIEPSILEIKTHPLYEMLSIARDTKTANHLYYLPK